MEKHQFCMNAASKIFTHYYNLALKEFYPDVAKKLAQLPADYVYNSLMTNYPNCYIDQHCCLEYCNEMLDTEFDGLTPEYKRNIYDKANRVQSSISDQEINTFLKAKRRKFKNIFYDAVHKEKKYQENSLNMMLEDISIKKRKDFSVDNVLKHLKLN